MKDWESDLENLCQSVSFIKTMLLDTDMKPELSHAEQAWVEELKEVLYDADDLFDEVITISKQRELYSGANFSKKILDKVSRFFSSKNRILVSYNTSQVVRNIQRKLDAIARDRTRYEFKFDPQATLKRKEETCSFLDETHENIIGREDDVKVAVDMLLDHSVEENVGFVAVVGLGGLGKTTLARLVYNDKRVGTMFEKKLWACVSDQDGKGLDVQAILGNIIESSTNKKLSDISTMQSMQSQLQEELKNKVYLLILDDVWTENPHEWNKLRRYLTIGGRGSRVVITTRSEKTAEVVLGKAWVHSDVVKTLVANWRCLRLLRLYVPDSEKLSESIGELLHLRYLDISENAKLKTLPHSIVKLYNLQSLIMRRCRNLNEWPKYFYKLVNLRLLDIRDCLNLTGMPLGIGQLTNLRDLTDFKLGGVNSSGKQFGGELKDLRFLLNVRGMLEITINENLTNEKEDVWEDGYLEHVKDLKVAWINFYEKARLTNNEALIAKLQPNRNLMELCLYGYNGTEIPRWGRGKDDWAIFLPKLVNIQLYNFKRMHGIPLLSNLKHLKFLTLFRLSNLEYMEHGAISRGCSRSKDVSFFPSLVNLRIDGLTRLKGWWGGVCEGDSSSCMPHWQPPFPRLSKLAIEECPELASLPPCPALESLHLTRSNKSLRILPGQGPANLDLKLEVNLDSVGYLTTLAARCLTDIVIQNDDELKRLSDYEEVFKSSYSSLRKLRIKKCKRLTSVSVGLEHLTALDDWAITFPNLVEITLSNCERLDGIPVLSNLKHLKSLTLSELNNLEYMEISAISRIGSSGSKDIPFFPSLEFLELEGLERLKGWWKGVGDGNSTSGMPLWLPSFPRLSTLTITDCAKLISLPPCPSLESLWLNRINKVLRILPGEGPANLDLSFYVEVDSVGYLATLSAFRFTSITINDDQESKSLSEIEEVFKSSSSLRRLDIENCGRLTSVKPALEHLTALESLSLDGIPIVDEEFEDDMLWRSLSHNLRSLQLKSLDALKMLPRGMKHLTALEKLYIDDCKWLKGLPEWIGCLSSLESLMIDCCDNLKSLGGIQSITSLQKLHIYGCSYLKERCEEPRGKEWPNIQHIPYIFLP